MKLAILAKIWYKKKLGLNVMIEIRNQIDFYLYGQKYRYFIVRFFNGSGYFIYIFYSTVVN